MRVHSARRKLLGMCLVVSVGAACAPAASRGFGAATGPRELVYVQAGDHVSALDTASGDLVMSARDVAVPHEWSSILTASPGSGGTDVAVLSPADASKSGHLRVPTELELTVASNDGSLVALATPRRPGATPWLPDGRKVTNVAVAETGTGETLEFRLQGNYEPEAFSVTGEELFMIEYIPAMAPDRYRVRRLKLANGNVVPIGRLKQAAPEQMRGTGRMQVMAPDGGQLYTLYTRQGPNYAHGDSAQQHSPGMVHSFVHLLDLTDGWAHCIDLPMPFGKGSATASAITMSAAGGPLYVTDWSNGAVVKVSPNRLRVSKVKRISLGAPDDETFAQSGFMTQRLFVAGESDIVVLDQASLEVVDRWDLGSEVTGLFLTPDEKRLFVSLGNRVVQIDPSTGAETAALNWPGAGAILGVATSEVSADN